MKNLLIAVIAALGVVASSPGVSQGAVPSRHEALRSATRLLHSEQQMRSTFHGEATEAVGLYWRSLAPKIRRVKGGWNTCAVIVRGRDEHGRVLVRLGVVKVRSFRGGFSVTLHTR